MYLFIIYNDVGKDAPTHRDFEDRFANVKNAG